MAITWRQKKCIKNMVSGKTISSLFKSLIIIVISILFCENYSSAQTSRWYNTDSLLIKLSANKKLGLFIHQATIIYNQAHIDSANISIQAFMVAFLEKKLIEQNEIKLKGLRYYKKKQLLTVVDYTKPGNRPRMATIDLLHKKVICESLVTQGAGSGTKKNDKYNLPVFFSNESGSECSSLGIMLATKGTHPDNPCHLCRFTLLQKHDCVVELEGLEKGINDHVHDRDVVMHTTGSQNFGTDSLRRLVKIKDTLYKLLPDSCKCLTGRADGSIKRTDAYATQCGIADNAGYMGQSNGCLVLPEENHIAMMNKIKGGSMIFIYSNIVTEETDYFRDSPVIKKMMKLAPRKMKHNKNKS